MKPEAETGVMQLRPQEPQEPLGAGRGGKGAPLEPWGKHGAANASSLNFRLSELRENEFSVVLSQVYGNLLQ